MEKREETGRREMVAPGGIIRDEAGMSGPKNSLLLSLLSPPEGVVQLPSRLSPLSDEPGWFTTEDGAGELPGPQAA